MSIGPVQSLGLVKEQPVADAVRPASTSQTTAPQNGTTEKVAQPGVGTQPRQEASTSKSAPALSELPQDEVQVQRDSQIRDEVVIKYLNTATGDLILQVPSAQVLSVDRGIYQEFAQQTATRASASAAAVADKGDERHGH